MFFCPVQHDGKNHVILSDLISKHSEIILMCSCFTPWCYIWLYAICVCIDEEVRALNFVIWMVSMFPQLRKSLCCRPLQPRTCSSSHIQRWCHGERPHSFFSWPFPTRSSLPLSLLRARPSRTLVLPFFLSFLPTFSPCMDWSAGDISSLKLNWICLLR